MKEPLVLYWRDTPLGTIKLSSRPLDCFFSPDSEIVGVMRFSGFGEPTDVRLLSCKELSRVGSCRLPTIHPGAFAVSQNGQHHVLASKGKISVWTWRDLADSALDARK